MLKNIRLHLEKDEEQQRKLEEHAAQALSTTHKQNINGFQRHIPSLLPYLSQQSTNYSVFCNKHSEFNIVDHGLGRTVYGFHPKAETLEHLQAFLSHSPYVNFATTHDTQTHSETDQFSGLLPGFIRRQSFKEMPKKVECLVVLGCGLGFHIEELLRQYQIQHLVIYEAEPQFFAASSFICNWKGILETAKKAGTGLYLQVGKDGRDILSDLSELRDHTNISGFYLYKHFNHIVYDTILEQLLSIPWPKLRDKGLSINLAQKAEKYVPLWATTNHLEHYQLPDKTSPLFQQNLRALKTYFPEILEQIENYTPRNWMPFVTQQGEINLIEKDLLVGWYSDTPKDDCRINLEGFSEHPNKDGLVLGYKGKKLAHYEHYKFVKKTEKLIDDVREQQGGLPENLQSLIIFGTGVGYQIELLFEQHEIQNVFICEPNPDFFYASLFAIDWGKIFEKVQGADARIYLNIGDDGSNLFRDLLSQFYSIGPYILNNTYFYQSYYNAGLNLAIAQLREQLQVVVAMGEYFDHAFYGITHTREGLKRNYPALVKRPDQHLSFDDKEVPVVLVGNGPSLDMSLDKIKEIRNQVILVSCGTSLQVLHRNGITPDFHAEIEQNRTTHDWAVLINDLEYLKSISLITCNGIHPDTGKLYKDVFIAFKEGESSTVSLLEAIGNDSFEILTYAFPTVSNFACDLFSKMGMSSIYLLGIDLGFVDPKYHHSKTSSYYTDDGDELYDYTERNNTSLTVQGNFRPTVNTKHEFKVSKQIIEQAIAKSAGKTFFYNCSDGARIVGASPLPLEDILILTDPDNKVSTVAKIKQEVFSSHDFEDAINTFDEKYQFETLCNELDTFETYIHKDIKTFEEGQELINKQKELLFLSYQHGKSLLFYYLYGTVNYSNAVLTKLLYSDIQSDNVSEDFIQGVTFWKHTYGVIKAKLQNYKPEFDTSSFSVQKRELLSSRVHTRGQRILLVTNSSAFSECVARNIKRPYTWQTEVVAIDFSQLKHYQQDDFEYAIYFHSPTSETCTDTHSLLGSEIFVAGKLSTLVLIDMHEVCHIRQLLAGRKNLRFMPVYYDRRPERECHWMANQAILAHLALGFCVSSNHGHIILPKYIVRDSFDSKEWPQDVLSTCLDATFVYDFDAYFLLSYNELSAEEVVSRNRTRGKKRLSPPGPEDLILRRYPDKEFARHIEAHIKNFPSLLKDRRLNSM